MLKLRFPQKFLLAKKWLATSDVPKREFAVAATPGLFFILLGLIALFAPQLLIVIAASILMFIGILLCYVSWQVIHAKRKIDKLLKTWSSRVYIQTVNYSDSFEEELEDEAGKKITLH